jgi:hypothetical protein
MCDHMQEQKRIRINQVFFRVALATLLPQYQVELARSGEIHAAPLVSSRSAKRRRQSDGHEVLPNLVCSFY